MSLRVAVQSVVEKMKADNGHFALVLEKYIALLEMALLATEMEQPTSPPKNMLMPGIQQMKMQEEAEITVAKKLLREIGNREEVAGASMTQAVGGSSDGDYIDIDPQMPVGAKTFVVNQVYQLRADGKLYYMEEDTKKIQEERQGAKKIPILTTS